jgi:O-methyltransferase
MDDRTATLYLDLLKRCLTRYDFGARHRPATEPEKRWKRAIFVRLRGFLNHRGLELMEEAPFDPAVREAGRDWPLDAETMIGLRRLNNLHECVVDALRRGVQGDLIETGVWRGGATIFMRAVLQAYADTDRRVWVADSFQGLPEPNPAEYPQDADDRHHTHVELAVSLDQVQDNFRRYGLLDDQVRFLPGWFHETLPRAPIERLAVLRLDGDMYESTIVALEALYPKLSPGGYLIVDDYGAVPGCRQAVDDYRRVHGITEPIEAIDWGGVYWQRASW